MSKRLPYRDFKNAHVDIKLKWTFVSLLTKHLMNTSKIYLEKAEKSYSMLLR